MVLVSYLDIKQICLGVVYLGGTCDACIFIGHNRYLNHVSIIV